MSSDEQPAPTRPSTLRERPVVRRAHLPDGRVVAVRVHVPEDPYIPRSELDTVVVELLTGDDVIGVVTTPLSAGDVERALVLGDRIRAGLEEGSLAPTAEGIDAIATTVPEGPAG
jgi:hypothetical protein